MAKDAKAKGPGAKEKVKLQQEYNKTRPCRLCRKPLIEAATTLGHTQSVCNAYKAKMEKEAAKKAKKSTSSK